MLAVDFDRLADERTAGRRDRGDAFGDNLTAGKRDGLALRKLDPPGIVRLANDFTGHGTLLDRSIPVSRHD